MVTDYKTNIITVYYCVKLTKKLSIGISRNGGRNNRGIICVHHRGGGSKHNFKLLDYYRRINCSGLVLRVYKTPFRTALVGLITHTNGLATLATLSEHNYVITG
jgi:ribosomal protein L2